MKRDTFDKRIAAQRLHLTDGTVLKNVVVEFKDEKPVKIYPLVCELPQTEWIQGDFFLADAEAENLL